MSYIKYIIITCIILGMSGMLVFLQFRYEIEWALQKGEFQTSQIIDRLSKIMLLPAEEIPNIVQLIDSDVYKQRNPDFFQNAEDFNYLIIFKNLAILFDARQNKIINIGPIVNDSNT